jgi:hypothetical protein
LISFGLATEIITELFLFVQRRRAMARLFRRQVVVDKLADWVKRADRLERASRAASNGVKR